MKTSGTKSFKQLLTALFKPAFCLYLLQIISLLVVLLMSPIAARAEDNVILSFELPNDPQPGKSMLAPMQESVSQAGSQTVARSSYAAPGLDRSPTITRGEVNSPQDEDSSQRLVASVNPASGIDFEPKPVGKSLLPAASEQRVQPLQAGLSELTLATQLFRGDADSLAAKAIGAAEGTRTPTGTRTPAYYGHVDPGNGVWNLGTFSYQHGAVSPEEADRKQLRRLANQAETLRQKALEKGMVLTVEEKLNGLDLANQAPLAALGEEGYIDWLAEAHRRGLTGSEAVIWARTYSFVNPRTGEWDAPGLGNNLESIVSDQRRRFRAIDRTIIAYRRQQQNPAMSAPEKPQAMDRPPRPQPPSLSEAEVTELIIGAEPSQPATPASKVDRNSTPSQSFQPLPAPAANPALAFNQLVSPRSQPQRSNPSPSQQAINNAKTPEVSPMAESVESIEFIDQQ